MTNLKLITIENFGELQCNFYRNMNDDILLTREQIGTALEYSNPSTAIKNLHRKHKDRLDSLSMKIKLGRLQNEPTSKSDEQERVYYTERGIMEICRWSRQPKANLFIGETTQEGMDSVGTSLNSIFSRMGNIKLSRLKDPESGEDLNIWGIAA